MGGIYLQIELTEEGNLLTKEVKVKQLSLKRVVKVRSVVGDFVDPINDLLFEGRTEVEKVFRQLGCLSNCVIVGMLDDALADFKRQVESAEIEVAVLELFHDTKGVEIVVKPSAIGLHQLMELLFARMAKRRVTNVVGQRQGFHKLGVQAECSRNRAGNLRHLEGMRQPVSEVIGETGGEDLRFGFQPAKRAGVHNAVAIARIFAAVEVWQFREATAAGSRRLHGPGCRFLRFVDGRDLPQ